MKIITITVFETFDGKRFDSLKDATHHLNIEHEKALIDASKHLSACHTYDDVHAWLSNDINLERIIRIIEIRKDMSSSEK